MDIGSHRIDLLLRLGGTIRDVRALCGTVAANYKAEDCASLVFRFSGAAGRAVNDVMERAYRDARQAM